MQRTHQQEAACYPRGKIPRKQHQGGLPTAYHEPKRGCGPGAEPGEPGEPYGELRCDLDPEDPVGEE